MDYNDILFVICVIVITAIFYYLIRKHREYSKINKGIDNKTKTIIDNNFAGGDKSLTILEIFKNIAFNKNKNIIAFKVYRDTIWSPTTYREYYNGCVRFALSLIKNCGNNIYIGILGHNSPAWIYTYLGTMMANSISIPINHKNMNNETINRIIMENKISVLVVENSFQLKKIIINDYVKIIIMYSPINNDDVMYCKNININLISFVDFINNIDISEINNFSSNIMLKHDKYQTATIIYDDMGEISNEIINVTPIKISYCNIYYSLNYFTNCAKNKLGSKYVSYLPLYKIINQIMDIFLPIVTNGCIWFTNEISNNSIDYLIETLIVAKPTLFIGTPFIWNEIKKKMNSFLSITKFIIPTQLILKKIGLCNSKLNILYYPMYLNINKNDYLIPNININMAYGLTETTGLIAIDNEMLNNIKIKITNGLIYVKSNVVSIGKSLDWLNTGINGTYSNKNKLLIGKNDIIMLSDYTYINPLPIEKMYMEKYNDIILNIVIVGKNDLRALIVFKNKNNKNNIIKDIKYINIENKFRIGKELTNNLNIRRSYIQKIYSKEINQLFLI